MRTGIPEERDPNGVNGKRRTARSVKTVREILVRVVNIIMGMVISLVKIKFDFNEIPLGVIHFPVCPYLLDRRPVHDERLVQRTPDPVIYSNHIITLSSQN